MKLYVINGTFGQIFYLKHNMKQIIHLKYPTDISQFGTQAMYLLFIYL